MRHCTVLILGGTGRNDEAEAALREQLLAAGQALGFVVNTRALRAEDLSLWPSLLHEAAGVLLAPVALPEEARSLDTLVRALQLVRESGQPFLSVGAPAAAVALELLCTSSGRSERRTALNLEHRQAIIAAEPPRDAVEILLEPDARRLYGQESPVTVATQCVPYRFRAPALADLARTGWRPRAFETLTRHPIMFQGESAVFHWTALFHPRRGPRGAHPLVAGLVAAAVGRRGP